MDVETAKPVSGTAIRTSTPMVSTITTIITTTVMITVMTMGMTMATITGTATTTIMIMAIPMQAMTCTTARGLRALTCRGSLNLA